MSIFVTELQRLLGPAPAGFEWLEYVVAALFLVFLVNACVSFISSLFLWIGGRM